MADWTDPIGQRREAVELRNLEMSMPTNQLYNRVRQEEYKNKIGQYQDLGDDVAFNQFMGNQLLNNAQNNEVPVQSAQPIQNAVQPQTPLRQTAAPMASPLSPSPDVTPQNINALMSTPMSQTAPDQPGPTNAVANGLPQGAQDKQQAETPSAPAKNMIMTMQGPVDKDSIPPNLRAAAARSSFQYNQLAEQQENQATATEFATISKDLYGMITDTKPGDQDKLSQVREYVEHKPKLLNAFKRAGIYQYMQTATLQPGGVNEVPHYFSQEELDKLPPKVKDPLRAPGWYTETSRYDKKTGGAMIEGLKSYSPTEDFLAQVIAAEGPDAKSAQRTLDIKQGMSTKTKTPEQLRSVFTDPNKPLESRNKAFQDYILANNTKEQLASLLQSPNLTPDMRSQAEKIEKHLQTNEEAKAKAGAARIDARQEKAREAGKESVEELSDMLIAKEMKSTTISDFKGKRSAAIAMAKRKDTNYSPAVNDADIEANTRSLAKLQYRQDTLEGAVNNVKGQVAKFKSMKPAGMQTNVLALNTMGNKFLSGFVGNVDKAKLDTVFQELSTEITKIASDSTGSVAQAAQGAKEKWDKIHNTNYRWKDAADLIGFIQELADVRFESGQTVLKGVKSRIRGDKNSQAPKDPLGIR